MSRTLLLAACLALTAQAPAQAQVPNAEVRLKSTFSDGRDDGWLDGRGQDQYFWVDPSLGNTAPALHLLKNTDWTLNFGIEIENRKPEWLLALKQGRPVRISLDAKALEVSSWPGRLPLPRELYVEFRDYKAPPPGFPYVSVWKRMGVLDQRNPGWSRMAATIDNPLLTNLPPGWGGYGAEDSRGRPLLPEGRTFANVLANADTVAFTTYKPGFAYGWTYWDVLFDNITIRTLQR